MFSQADIWNFAPSLQQIEELWVVRSQVYVKKKKMDQHY